MMVQPYAILLLTNLLHQQSLFVTALGDASTTSMCAAQEIALNFAFNIADVPQQTLYLAPEHRHKISRISPIEITFENRTYVAAAVPFGSEPLLSLLQRTAVELDIDPQRQILAHPNYQVVRTR